MSLRLIATWVSTVIVGSAAAAGWFDGGAAPASRVTVTAAAAANQEPGPTMVPALPSAEPASPTVTPLPPPPIAPPDAVGIRATTPPIGAVSPQPAPTLPDTLWLASGDESTVRIEVHGGLPYAPVVVNGVRREFLLSTSTPSQIDSSLTPAGNAEVFAVRTLQIGEVRLTNARVFRERIAPFSQTYLGATADGVLGSEFFGRYAVTIDYPKRTLTTYRTEAAAASARAADAVVLPLEMVNGLPAIQCAVDGINATPCFVATDAVADLMLAPSFGDIRRLARNGPVIGNMRAALPGREMAGRLLRAHSLTVGTISIARPLAEVPDEFGGYDEPATVWTQIGSGTFGHFAVSIDEPAGKFALIGPGSAGSDFDRSGLWLVWRNGAIVVRSVERRSPADKAGIVSGDMIVAVDELPAQDLDVVRSQLVGEPGQTVTIAYQRGGQRHSATVTLRTLI